MGYHILIADDEDRIVRNMCQIIKDAFGDEVEVRMASNGLECVRIMREWLVNLLITDIRMPGLNGIELVEEIRKTDSRVEILVISAYEDFNYAKKLIPYGVLDYLVKPINVDLILGKVRSALGRHGERGRKEKTGAKRNGAEKDSIEESAVEYGMGEKEEADGTEEKYHTRSVIRDAKAYIAREIYSPVSLTDVAEHLHISKSYLSAIFKNETGENISGYINSVKVKEAKRLLLKTEMSVQEISEKLGYSTSKYFIEKFSKSTGISPAKYRGLLHKNI